MNELTCRQVQDELKHAPWTSIAIGDSSLFVKSKFTESCYYIIVTDLLRLWIRFSDYDGVKEEKEQYNPQLDTPISQILEILKQHLNEQKSGSAYTLTMGDKLSIHLSTNIEFYVFQWTLEMHPMPGGPTKHASYLRDHVVVPLILINNELHRQLEQAKPGKRKEKKESVDLSIGETLQWYLDETSIQIYKKYISRLDPPETRPLLRKRSFTASLTSSSENSENASMLLVYASGEEEQENSNSIGSEPYEGGITNSQAQDTNNASLGNLEDESPEELQRRKLIEEKIARENEKRMGKKRTKKMHFV